MKRNRIGLIVLTAMLCISTAVFANWRETVDIGNLRVKTLTANPGFGNTSITVASPITLSGDLTLEADLVLETGGIIRNDAVDDFEFLGTNQTATLAELIVGTTANQSTIANNDLFNIKAVAPDSASNDTSYATIVLQITDKTTTSEDGQIVLKAMKAGSDTTIATLGYTSAGAEVGTFTVPIDCDSLTVDAGGAGIDAQSGGALAVGSTTATSLNLSKSAAMTTVKGTFNVDQAATFDTTVRATGVATFDVQSVHTLGADLNGPSTATNITMDAGSTLAAQAVTVASTMDMNGVATCTNLSLDAGATLTVGTATIVPTSATELTISETTVTVSGTTLAAPALTCTSISTATGEATVDGKYAVVGGDATTGLMIQKGDGAAVTNGATVTFATVFGGTPTVILGADESTTTVPYPSSVTPSNFVVNGEAAKVQNWMAVGTRP